MYIHTIHTSPLTNMYTVYTRNNSRVRVGHLRMYIIKYVHLKIYWYIHMYIQQLCTGSNIFTKYKYLCLKKMSGLTYVQPVNHIFNGLT